MEPDGYIVPTVIRRPAPLPDYGNSEASSSVAHHSLVIVGCGLSGLYAARLLHKHFPGKLCLLEAMPLMIDRLHQRVRYALSPLMMPSLEPGRCRLPPLNLGIFVDPQTSSASRLRRG